MNNPLKVLVLSGTLTDIQFEQKLTFNYCDINKGNWEISVGEISFLLKTVLPQKLIIELSSNFVNGYVYTKIGKLCLLNVPLIKVEIPKDQLSGVIYLPQRWFQINSKCDIVYLFSKFWPTISINKLILKDSIINISLFLRRIN